MTCRHRLQEDKMLLHSSCQRSVLQKSTPPTTKTAIHVVLLKKRELCCLRADMSWQCSVQRLSEFCSTTKLNVHLLRKHFPSQDGPRHSSENLRPHSHQACACFFLRFLLHSGNCQLVASISDCGGNLSGPPPFKYWSGASP